MTDNGGRRQGRYVLGDLLGRGGMAEVFAGHSMGDHGFQKPVAIKQLLPELANDHVFVERLIGEAKLLVGMTHGNIVSVLDLARDGDDVFLVMEYVDGPSLRQLLKARGTRGLPLGVVTYILQSAAQGLEFAHARPGGAVIHADISPSNLLLTTSGEVRVADFGIARREGLGGVVEGKWAYMAPEQARGEPLTPRSDIFAFGVVLYELLTGQHPFGRQVTADERDNHEPMRIIPPRVVKPSVPPGLDTICMRCLQHEPRARYGRMQEVHDALVEERFANGYREGSADLALAIREVQPEAAVHQPRTQITDRPVTIVTRSLLSQPQKRPSGRPITEAASQPPERSSTSKITDSRTPPAPEAPLTEIPPLIRADGTPMPPFRLRPVLMPGEGLAGVVGGATVTGSAKIELPTRNHRLTFMIFGMAALVGAIAAIAIELSPNSSDDIHMADKQILTPVDVASRLPWAHLITKPDPNAPPYDPDAEVIVKPPTEDVAAADVKAPTNPANGDEPQAVVAAPVTTDPKPANDVKADVKPDVKAVGPDEPKLADDTKPADTTKPVETAKLDAPKPADPKPADPKPADPKPVDPPHRPITSTPSHPVVTVSTHRHAELGILRVTADPWAFVEVDGDRQDSTGGTRFMLQPGKHSVHLSNEHNKRTCMVTIEPGKNTILKVSMTSGDCN